MDLLTIIFVAFALSMDAFAVSICLGTHVKHKTTIALRAGIFFGLFQAVMPLIGWALGFFLKDFMQQADHWIVFGLLSIIGIRMINEAATHKNEKRSFNTKSFWVMVSLSIATSIDALAVGLSFALLKIPIIIAVIIIGVITFAVSYTGVHIGKRIGIALGNKAEIIGGIVLICIGLFVLIEHLYNHY